MYTIDYLIDACIREADNISWIDAIYDLAIAYRMLKTRRLYQQARAVKVLIMEVVEHYVK